MRQGRPIVRLLLIGLTFALWPGQAWAKWTRVTSAHFTFVGDAPEGMIRRVAERLEQFRESLLRVLPGLAAQSPVPTVVVVFSNERSLAPARPLFQGRPVDVAGYFQPGEDLNYMAINADFLDVALPATYHEFSHFLLSNGYGQAPVWVSEGLAEFYQVMEPQNGGKSVLLGRPPGEHVALLKASTLMSIRELTQIDHNSPDYNEGSRRGVFYAQSWALVHYLTVGNPARAPQFRDYLARIRSGTPSAEAFSGAFGTDAALLDRELFEYVRRFLFPGLRADFDEKLPDPEVSRGVAITDVEADVYLGDLQARINRVDDGRARLTAVRKNNPKAARAVAALGLIDLRARRTPEAVAQLEQASSLAPDDAFIALALGRALVDRLQNESGTAREATVTKARVAVAQAVARDPDSGFGLSLLGYLELQTGGDPARAVTALERAVQLAPSRESWRMLLAQALASAALYDRARAALGPLMARGSTPAVREAARRLLTDVAARQTAGDTTAGTEALLIAPPLPAASAPERPGPIVEAGPEVAAQPSGGDPARRTAVGGQTRLDLRLVGAGETRVRGTFRSIECAASIATLIVESEGRTLRLRARRLAEVDFISYRSDPPANVTCGPVPAHPVLATYRIVPAGPGGDTGGVTGDAVAIELLPDGWRDTP
jgi:tetratricopeptide (TPR) repeat protein